MQSKVKVFSLSILVLIAVCSLIFYLSGTRSSSPQIETAVSSDAVQESSTVITKETKPSSESNDKTQAQQSTMPVVDEANDIADRSLASILTEPDVNPDYATFSDRISTVRARRNGQEVQADKIWEASKADSAWTTVDEAPDSLNLTREQELDGREFIKIDPLKIESLVHGDTLEVTIQQLNRTFTAHITDVISEDEGRSVTWKGYLDGLDSPNTITITRGSNLIVGGISTPQALYSLQANGEDGWLVDSSTLFVGGDEPIEVTPDMLDSDHDHSDS
ncbi:hypothetical protein [Reinekea blandensis]|uniref:Uncharacterized protein n=1 Tax=Reinekea blandensis MED297 TaxID=314283 RepID=A4B8Z3_9GAMM|nr:hypothetical protein [Reinekea blandensis]EAR11094.1 hypothetical protein MED297_19442 [Reinekea sp. MED297] [Reinekea blandensis MED297]